MPHVENRIRFPRKGHPIELHVFGNGFKFRGKRNDSTKIPYIVDVMAELRHETREELERQTFENALRLFRISREDLWNG